ncbi:hypothetical protein SAMN05444673_3426 [Bacillus sp. OV166]|uniref:hypothetical protein n=1 Tax=Bacillus sp. OV166 TaxID=1882763 RepID=UPI000A2AE6EE|nr:hypothetical protein [Bacillus sp. OV166]SMQ78422.1 hypothetical protein SAMN05444673_3426 [Bacillus sp. OV166]
MMKSFKFIAPIIALVFGLILPNTAFAQDKDCSDFSTWQEAQNYFESKGGSPTNNVDRLDGTNPAQGEPDGIVCENLQGYNGETWANLHPADGGGTTTPTPTPTPQPAPMPSTATNNVLTLIIGALGMVGYLFLRRTLNKSGS